MIGGQAIGARALGDGARRDLASELGGPPPAATQRAVSVSRDSVRRAAIRKP